MNRLFELAEMKKKLKGQPGSEKEIELIDKEALTYVGKGSEGQDLFISCLVNDLHFEKVE